MKKILMTLAIAVGFYCTADAGTISGTLPDGTFFKVDATPKEGTPIPQQIFSPGLEQGVIELTYEGFDPVSQAFVIETMSFHYGDSWLEEEMLGNVLMQLEFSFNFN